MFLARDEKGSLVNALEDELVKQVYYCPACGTSVRMRKGKNVRAHFAHESLKKCDFFHENEGPEHLENKKRLFYWAKENDEVEMEYPIPELKQIADIFINKKIALEIQCSPISCELLRERSNGYRRLGIQVLWLVGQKLWLKERLTHLQRDLLSFSQNMGFHLWELDQQRDILRLKYMIHQDLKGNLYYLIREFPYGQGNLIEILRLPYQKQRIASMDVAQDETICDYIRQQLYYKNPYWMRKQGEAYAQGKNLLNLDVQDWFPQVRPIENGRFCQITIDLQGYYDNFQAYYQQNPKTDTQKLYPPAFYQQYFLKNVVK
ncbi:competence protein CoiA family protein [Streptococcus infantis]|uniref:competence protein CoiA n=1 Tax=Streptococcus infantis TaxID=68892 RepID=UPI0039C27F7D